MAFPTSVENFYFRRGKFYTTACVTDDVEVAKLCWLRKENSELPSGQKKIVWIRAVPTAIRMEISFDTETFSSRTRPSRGSCTRRSMYSAFTTMMVMNKLRWNEYIGKTGIVVLGAGATAKNPAPAG